MTTEKKSSPIKKPKFTFNKLVKGKYITPEQQKILKKRQEARPKIAKEAWKTRQKNLIIRYLEMGLSKLEAIKLTNTSHVRFNSFVKNDAEFANAVNHFKELELHSYIDKMVAETMELEPTLMDSRKYSDFVNEKKHRLTAKIEKVKVITSDIKYQREKELLNINKGDVVPVIDI
jgi:hypothetical protein